MTDKPSRDAHHHAHVGVPPSVSEGVARPARCADLLDTQVGKAYELGDVTEFCRRAALDGLDLGARRTVEWRRGPVPLRQAA